MSNLKIILSKPAERRTEIYILLHTIVYVLYKNIFPEEWYMVNMSWVVIGIFSIMGGVFLSTNPDNSPYGVEVKSVVFFILFGLGCIILGLLSSSSSTSSSLQKNSIWPLSIFTPMNSNPKQLSSTEEAISTIKNLQNNMLFFNSRSEKIRASGFDIDKYGLRANLKWINVEGGQTWVPTSGGFFHGWDYVPTYGGSYQNWERQTPMEETIVIPFKDIKYLLYSQNSALIWLKSGLITIETKTEEDRQALIDSIYTMYSNVGITLRDYIAGTQDLTDAQKHELGINSGVLVTGIAKGGQADRAGCKPLDVFLEIDGKQIINREQFYSFLGSTSKHKLKVLHWAEIDGDLTVHGTVINFIIKPVPKQEKIVQIN